jgi:hypothetical protein
MRTLLCTLALLLGPGPTPDAIDAFSFDPEKVETGVALFYLKSNVDGSNASWVTHYYPDTEWIESLKWSESWPEATLVRARMDWKTFSVGRFEGYVVDAEGKRTLRNTLEADPKEPRVVIEYQGQTMYCDIPHYPWHSYDFDWASLVHVLPHLVDPEGEVELGRADVAWLPQPHYAFHGLFGVSFGGAEEREGKACRRYDVDGEALENRGGSLWIDRSNGRLVDYEMDLPDEPGFVSGKLKLVRAEPMTPEEWAAFIRTRKTEDEGDGED